jgi:hypothetical protein
METDECDASDRRSLAALITTLALVFGTYAGLRIAMPELPVQVYQALASLPNQAH